MRESGGYDLDTREDREPARPPKPRAEYPARASLRNVAAPMAPRGPAAPNPIPRAVAALVAVAGVLLVAGGILQNMVFTQATTITASLAEPPSQPVVVSAPGMLALRGPRVQVSASTAAGQPVFVGIGRASDVMAYLGQVKRQTVTGDDGSGVLSAKSEGSQASLPDPGSVDVWMLSQRAQGAAGLSWPAASSGQYVVVAASDGTRAAPTRLTFTWTGAQPHSFGAALTAVGAVFVICGLVLLIMLTSRARLERGDQ